MYLLIIYLPLLSSILSLLFAKFLGKNGSSLITVFCLFLTLLLSLFIFFEVVLSNHVCVIKLCKWIDVGFLNIYWEFLFDALTSIMLFVIVSISLCVHIYSIEYMYNDPHLCRFMSYLSLFTFFMLMLVTAGNYIQLFLGWEGVGFCSYLLINFWYTRIAANKAAMKALIINKIGDIALLLGIILFFQFYNALDFALINCSTWLIKKNIYLNIYFFLLNVDYLSIILFFFIIGACAKSAQIGLHTWLPDAMEGPTPVSALIHAATMVTAGVFLLLRSVQVLKYSESSLLLISFLGGITAFVAATIGLFQNDIKKVIAYSTCSQLGYMILSCGLNNYSGSLFHLMNHAFFKALLFLSAGAIIHSMLDQQDMRRMGMLVKFLPLSYIMILIGSLTIMGVPFLTGFYSKDFILEYIYSSKVFLNFFLYWLGVMSAFLTSFYSIKLLFLTFYNIHNSYLFIVYNNNNKNVSIKESGVCITIALCILFLGSIFIGFISKDLFIGLGSDIWIGSLTTESYKDSIKIFNAEFLPIDIKIIPLVFSSIAVVCSLYFFKRYIYVIKFCLIYLYYLRECKINNEKAAEAFKRKCQKEQKVVNEAEQKALDGQEENAWNEKFRKEFNLDVINFIKIFKFFFNAYYFNEIYNAYLYKTRNLGYILFKNLDKGIIEWIGPLSIVKNINKILNVVSKKNKGLIDHYVFVIILGLLSIVFYIQFLPLLIYDLKLIIIFFIICFIEIKKIIK